MQPTVYILASKRNGTLYVGVTSDLVRRVHDHRNAAVDGFTKIHDVRRLVWFEQHATMESAIVREKRLKKWRRAWKLDLIETNNPDWRDLGEDIGLPPLWNWIPAFAGMTMPRGGPPLQNRPPPAICAPDPSNH